MLIQAIVSLPLNIISIFESIEVRERIQDVEERDVIYELRNLLI